VATLDPKKKIIIAVASGLGVIVMGFAISLYLSRTPSLSHWPHVPDPELFVTTQPKQDDVLGIYQLNQQTITTNGLGILEGRMCQLYLRPDGSFAVTNYPRWSVRSSSIPHVAEFISTTGSWRCDTAVNISYNGHQCWGVVFSDGHAGIDALALRNGGAPYDLMFTYGDGDDGTVMTFGRKK
jgi:hypothetical protein